MFLTLLFSTKDCLHKLHLSVNPGKSLPSTIRLKVFSLCMHKMGCVTNSGPMKRTAQKMTYLCYIVYKADQQKCVLRRGGMLQNQMSCQNTENEIISYVKSRIKDLGLSLVPIVIHCLTLCPTYQVKLVYGCIFSTHAKSKDKCRQHLTCMWYTSQISISFQFTNLQTCRNIQ